MAAIYSGSQGCSPDKLRLAAKGVTCSSTREKDGVWISGMKNTEEIEKMTGDEVDDLWKLAEAIAEGLY